MNLIRITMINLKEKDIFMNKKNEIKKMNNALKLQVDKLESKVSPANENSSSIDQQKINILCLKVLFINGNNNNINRNNQINQKNVEILQ